MLLPTLAALLILQAPGSSVPPTPAAPIVLPRDKGWACAPEHEALRKADAAVVSAGVRQGLAGGEARLPTYEAVLAHAPAAGWPPAEICGDTLLVHGDDTLGDLMQGALLQSKLSPPRPSHALASPMPYPYAALLVGSINDEAGRFGRGLAALEQGAAWAPGNVGIASERAYALTRLNRNPEALAVADAALAANPQLGQVPVAMLQRKRGFALGEMGRYDEGVLAYRISLQLDPADQKPLNEIRYLEGRKAGRGPSPTEQSNTAKDRAPTSPRSPAPPPSASDSPM